MRTLFSLLLAAALATGAQADPGRWQLDAHSDRHSDALPLRDLDDEVYDRLRLRSGRALAYIDDELRASRRQGDWRFSLLARQRATLVLNRDALELLAQVKKARPAQGDRAWQAEARLRAFAGAGLALERQVTLADGWQARAGAQGLVLMRWRERHIDGPVRYDAATGAYSFDLRSRETNDRLDFPFQQGFDARGAALLLHGELAWQGEHFDAAAGVRDAGWLHWRGIPQQQAQLSTSTQAVDADGFLLYRPLVQGTNRQAGLTQSAPWRYHLRAGWRLTPTDRLELAADGVRDYGLLPRLAWQHRQGDWQAALTWRTHERRLDLGLGWRGWRLQAGTDRFGSAHSRLLGLSWQSGF